MAVLGVTFGRSAVFFLLVEQPLGRLQKILLKKMRAFFHFLPEQPSTYIMCGPWRICMNGPWALFWWSKYFRENVRSSSGSTSSIYKSWFLDHMKFNTGDACLFGSRTFFGIFCKVISLSKLYFLSINKVLIIMQSDILNIIYYFNEKE